MPTRFASPAYDIAQLLEDKGVGVLGYDIFVGMMPQSTNISNIDKCIGVYDTGGVRSLPTYQRDEMLIRFQIRGNPNEYGETYNFANSLKEAVNGCKPVTINDKDYILFVLVGDINSLGIDDRDRPRFSLRLRIVRENSDVNSSRLEF